MQVVLAALLSNPEIRDVLFQLRAADDGARDEIRQIAVASARILFDYPVNEHIQRLAEHAASDYIARLPRGRARSAAQRYKRQLGFEDLLSPPRRRRSRRDDPAFLDFASKLLGTYLRGSQSTAPINPADILAAAIESETPSLHAAIANTIGQSNPTAASSPPHLRAVGEGAGE